MSPEKTGTGGGNDGDDNVVQFPKTAEERRALRKAKEALEKQRLINVFIDEAGGDKALFHTSDGVAYADLMINGHREGRCAQSNFVTLICGICSANSISLPPRKISRCWQCR